jgi:Domain of unknown function (DUF2760)
MGLGLALKAFFRALRDRTFAEQLDRLLQGHALAPSTTTVSPLADRLRADPGAQAPTRSDALTLLATLQREARLIDFLMEDLARYDDAQIGAAVRDVHRDCAAALERMFALRPLRYQEEGSRVEILAGDDPVQVKLTGNVTGPPPLWGTLVHHGWQAMQCELPEWSGQEESARVIAPAEVAVQ